MQQLKKYLKYYLDTGLILTRDGFPDVEMKGLPDGFGYEYWTPLMHPLSSLTKEIVVENYNDGKPFVPVDEFYFEYGGGFSSKGAFSKHIKTVIVDSNRDSLTWDVVQKLISWGFWIGSQDYFDKGIIKEI